MIHLKVFFILSLLSFYMLVNCDLFVDKVDNVCLDKKFKEVKKNKSETKCLKEIKKYYTDRIGKYLNYENCELSNRICIPKCVEMTLNEDCIYISDKKTQEEIDREKESCSIAKKNSCRHCTDYILGICIKHSCLQSTPRCKELGY
jgi:hypothetical protein